MGLMFTICWIVAGLSLIMLMIFLCVLVVDCTQGLETIFAITIFVDAIVIIIAIAILFYVKILTFKS